jgi:hypothetical protein
MHLTAIRLSPDQKFLFASNAGVQTHQQITTLYFSESPLTLSYGCIVTVRGVGPPATIGGLATVLPNGSGGGLYVAESASNTASAAIGLLAINPTTGCLEEAPQSPFPINSLQSALSSVAAWPPRPF